MRSWALWSTPRRVVCYVLTIEALACAMIAMDLLDGIDITAGQWGRFAILLTVAHAHQLLSRDHEARRRADHGSEGLHADLTAVFTFAAAALLPMPLTVVLIVTVRAARYTIARKPPYKFVLATASIILAAYSVHTLLHPAGAFGTPESRWSLKGQALLVAAGVLYIAQQMLTIGAAVVLAANGRRPSAVAIFGNREHLASVLLSVSLGIVFAATGAAPVTAAIMLFAAVSINSLIGHRERGRRDGHTGLPTKQRWSELADAAIRVATRSQLRPAVLVIDLDHFKQVNDTWGHLVGDLFLLRVATVLTHTLRDGDIAGRFGGEEFVVLLSDGEDVRGVAERIREEIARIELIFERAAGGKKDTLSGRTASVGAALTSTPRETTLRELLGAADAAAYAAKRNGRNQVRVAVVPEPRDAKRTPVLSL
ncbi:GGDEF domain-containing protein [Lentzea sp. NBRC 105346]|uniref:GGDEF domain-containing protein n=1 Tax=Lentzea sp. NBRC 105346 TaxID=3032205 RepID=UPI0024A30BE5|nr:GGDEF domain-containing protein [Lentzea sp. NBRC 105346]GLZ28204.1 GGDEF domain-containing protein [Lentzea sp. NBRC 105346]